MHNSRRLQKKLKTQTNLSLFDCMLSFNVNSKKLIFYLVIALLKHCPNLRKIIIKIDHVNCDDLMLILD